MKSQQPRKVEKNDQKQKVDAHDIHKLIACTQLFLCTIYIYIHTCVGDFAVLQYVADKGVWITEDALSSSTTESSVHTGRQGENVTRGLTPDLTVPADHLQCILSFLQDNSFPSHVRGTLRPGHWGGRGNRAVWGNRGDSVGMLP